jgi:hypothetical protein
MIVRMGEMTDCVCSNTSYLTTSTLNTKYIWAVLIKLHDSATYDDRRKSYELLKHQALKCNLSL